MAQHATSLAAVERLVEQLGPGPWRRAEVLAAGWTDGAVRRAVEYGRLIRPHRGVLALPDPSTHAALRASLLVTRDGGSGCSQTAGDVHGLWLPRRDGLVHVSVPGEPDRLDHGMRVHGSRLPERFVETVHGLRVTTVARTAVDLARGERLPDALMVMDSAARALAARDLGYEVRDLRDPGLREAAGTHARSRLWEAFEAVRGWPGTVVARAAIELLDPGSESPLESVSRGWMIEGELPPPLVGHRVVGASGTVYWGDFAWLGPRVLGEADGIGKYGTEETAVQRALRAERSRQQDLEDAGWRFVRWGWTDSPRSLLSRLRSLGV
jgi:hypothetical protein